MYFLPSLMWNLKSFYHYPPFSSFEKGYLTFQGSGVEGTGDFLLIWKPLEDEVKNLLEPGERSGGCPEVETRLRLEVIFTLAQRALGLQ